jgi:hypothetical protein
LLGNFYAGCQYIFILGEYTLKLPNSYYENEIVKFENENSKVFVIVGYMNVDMNLRSKSSLSLQTLLGWRGQATRSH